MKPRPAQELAWRLRLSATPPLLERALTHGSINQTGTKEQTHVTLAYLGDAVLELVLRQESWKDESRVSLGRLCRRDDRLARNRRLAQRARAVGLEDYLRAADDRASDSDRVLATAVEAVLAAVFLADGLSEAARCARLLLHGSLRQPRRAMQTELTSVRA